MSKMDEFFKSEKPRIAPEVVEVDVCCQRCNEYVDEAEYFFAEKILKWRCSKDHVSYMEEFRL